MKRTSLFFLSITLFCLSFNTSAYSMNSKGNHTSAIKKVGKLVLAAGKITLGVYAILVSIALPVIVLQKDITALTGSYRINAVYNNSTKTYTEGYNDVNLIPALYVGVGIASMAHFVVANECLNSALKDVQEVFS